jgi:hypothetical protein
LQNPSLMRIILLNDGTRQEQYQSMLDLYHSILDASPRAKNGIQLNDIQGGHLRILRGNRGKFDQVRSQIGGGYDSCQGQCSKASDCSRAVFGVWGGGGGGPAVLVLAGWMSFSYNQKAMTERMAVQRYGESVLDAEELTAVDDDDYGDDDDDDDDDADPPPL